VIRDADHSFEVTAAFWGPQNCWILAAAEQKKQRARWRGELPATSAEGLLGEAPLSSGLERSDHGCRSDAAAGTACAVRYINPSAPKLDFFFSIALKPSTVRKNQSQAGEPAVLGNWG